MFRQRTFVGLDVHARSVVGHAMDEHTGEVWQQRPPSDPPGIWGWLESLPQPVKVTYEVGPTGYALAGFSAATASRVRWRHRPNLTSTGGESGQNRRQGRGASVPAVTSG